MMKKFLLCFILFICIVLTSCDFNNSNDKVYKKFNTEFEQIKTQIESSNQIVFDMNIEMDIWDNTLLVGKTDVKTNFKVNADPMYIEANMRTGVESLNYVYEQIGDSIYQYELNNNAAISTYIGSVEEFESSEENSALGFEFDNKKGTAHIEDDYYIFTQKYSESLSEDEKSYLEDLYETLGLSLDDVLNSDYTIRFKFNENGFYMSYDMTINMQYPDLMGFYKELTIKAFIEYEFKIEEFEMINIDEYEVVSDKIENVSRYSNLDTYYSYYMDQRYYKFNLKKGYYYFDTNANYNIYPNFYDSNRKIIFPNNILDVEKKMIYYIPKDGDYYIHISSYYKPFALKEVDISNRKVLNLKYNQEMVFNLNQDQFVAMKINDVSSILIENTGDNDIKLTSTDLDTYYIVPAKTKMYVFIGILPKDLLIKNIGANGEECRVKINKIESAGVNLSYDKLEEITTTPSKGYYIHGGYLDIPMMKLIVEESGFYTFKNNCEESMNFSYVIEYYNGGYIQYIEDSKYYLDEGEYIIRLENNDIGFSYGNVYYEFEKYEAKTSYEIELEKTDKKTYESDYPTITLYYTIGAEYYKYYFNITQDCIVETYNYIYLYDEFDNIVTGTSQKLFNLKPGRYYFKSDSRSLVGTEKIKIAITG